MTSQKSISTNFTLYDDESTYKKCTVMTKWDAAADDSRNTEFTEGFSNKVEEFLKFGKTYRIIVEEI